MRNVFLKLVLSAFCATAFAGGHDGNRRALDDGSIASVAEAINAKSFRVRVPDKMMSRLRTNEPLTVCFHGVADTSGGGSDIGLETRGQFCCVLDSNGEPVSCSGGSGTENYYSSSLTGKATVNVTRTGLEHCPTDSAQVSIVATGGYEYYGTYGSSKRERDANELYGLNFWTAEDVCVPCETLGDGSMLCTTTVAFYSSGSNRASFGLCVANGESEAYSLCTGEAPHTTIPPFPASTTAFSSEMAQDASSTQTVFSDNPVACVKWSKPGSGLQSSFNIEGPSCCALQSVATNPHHRFFCEGVASDSTGSMSVDLAAEDSTTFGFCPSDSILATATHVLNALSVCLPCHDRLCYANVDESLHGNYGGVSTRATLCVDLSPPTDTPFDRCSAIVSATYEY